MKKNQKYIKGPGQDPITDPCRAIKVGIKYITKQNYFKINSEIHE